MRTQHDLSTLLGTLARTAAAAGMGLVLFAGCASDDADAGDDAGCPAGKCDTPQGDASTNCLQRMAEVISSTNRGYTPDHIRWACADVAGVTADGDTNDDRGQEYCEYFAMVTPPGGTGVDVGRPLDGQGRVSKLAICAPGDTSASCRTTLTEEQQIQLEDDPTAVVGKCVFTSWHADIKKPVPVCPNDKCPADANIMGLPFTRANYSMKVGFNSNGAAIDLIEKCFPLAPDKRIEVDWTNADDPAQQPYYRGCMGTNLLFGTEWRRSDPTICAGINRLAECGCTAAGITNATQLAQALLPPVSSPDARRGFRLGTWDNDKGLPNGCKYSNTGETGFLVECDMTAADLLANLNDPKEFCRSAYGNNVVVHVDVPRAAITCNPPDTNEAKTCGAIPWNIGQENAEVEPPTTDDGGTDDGATDDGGTDDGATTDSDAEDTTTGGEGGGDVGNCCSAHEGMGCTNDAISACVCAEDDFCCSTSWDETCVGLVTELNCGTCG
jgi:hypothetical protein